MRVFALIYFTTISCIFYFLIILHYLSSLQLQTNFQFYFINTINNFLIRLTVLISLYLYAMHSISFYHYSRCSSWSFVFFLTPCLHLFFTIFFIIYTLLYLSSLQLQTYFYIPPPGFFPSLFYICHATTYFYIFKYFLM